MQVCKQFPLVLFAGVFVFLGACPLCAQPSNPRSPISLPAPDANTTILKLAQVAIRSKSPDGKLPNRVRLNSSTVTVITAPVGGAWAPMGSDMARVLDDGENLRVLPIIGRGSVQNLVDVMLLKGVDMGFMVADAIDFFGKEYQVPNISNRVAYIVALYNNDLHIVARKEIKTIRDLAGKKIMSERNLGYFSVRTIFDRLKITADIDSQTDDALGLQKMLTGEADAWIVSAGKVAPIARNIKNDDGKLHFVPVPYEQALEDLYLPSSITNAEYPNLVAPGERVDTVAAPVLLMVYNWPPGSERYNRLANFVDAFFSKIKQFHDPSRHPKWRDTNLTAPVPGWRRFKAAEDWLARNKVAAVQQRAPGTIPTNAAEQERLFQQFLEWSKTQTKK
jgi:TRAP-type uncharacterized transport system substrate-binding protein